MVREDEIVYGTILKGKDDGILFKIVGGTTVNGEQCYEIQPLIRTQLLLKDWVLKNAEFVQDNPRGIPISFKV